MTGKGDWCGVGSQEEQGANSLGETIQEQGAAAQAQARPVRPWRRREEPRPAYPRTGAGRWRGGGGQRRVGLPPWDQGPQPREEGSVPGARYVEPHAHTRPWPRPTGNAPWISVGRGCPARPRHLTAALLAFSRRRFPGSLQRAAAALPRPDGHSHTGGGKRRGVHKLAPLTA